MYVIGEYKDLKGINLRAGDEYYFVGGDFVYRCVPLKNDGEYVCIRCAYYHYRNDCRLVNCNCQDPNAEEDVDEVEGVFFVQEIPLQKETVDKINDCLNKKIKEIVEADVSYQKEKAKPYKEIRSY